MRPSTTCSIEILEILMHSANVDEIFSEDVVLRRKMAPVLKSHMAVDEEVEREVRGKLKHVEEGTRTWEVEYARVMEEIRRRKGLPAELAKPPKFLVTGGAGFIGSNLVARARRARRVGAGARQPRHWALVAPRARRPARGRRRLVAHRDRHRRHSRPGGGGPGRPRGSRSSSTKPPWAPYREASKPPSKANDVNVERYRHGARSGAPRGRK